MSFSSRRQLLGGDATGPAASAQRPLPREETTVRLETRAMGCGWAVILDPGPADRFLTASSALQEVHRVEELLTVYRDRSDVARLNRDATREACAVTPELFELLLECRRLQAETWGAFEPASQSLIQLWRTCREEGRVPDPVEITVALGQGGFSHVHLLPGSALRQSAGAAPDAGPECSAVLPRVRFDVEGLGLNFGAIGKGYAIDRATEWLRAGGITDFVVHGGHSSLYAAGGHAGQAGWPIGLKNPLFTNESYLTLLLRDVALGTSGSNIQYFRHGGRRYGHILDPRTGWPAEGLLSVSVLAPTAAEADALSTAFYVLGLEKTCEYCDTHRSVSALVTPTVERGRRLRTLLVNVPEELVFPVSEQAELEVWVKRCE